MKLSLLSVVAFAVSTLGSKPTPPALTLLYSATINKGSALVIESSSTGLKAVQAITGGSFSGSKISGTVVTGTAISVKSASGLKVEASFVLQTSDGANILVTERAAIPYVEATFETGSATYDWLNNVTAWATPRSLSNIDYLDYWQVATA
ncbi:uncharacterized protein N7511_010843 [Penicillium nucicola]|uniref:uncharacterized protein n=1 Tax=Penicillium nucicola TaxID=1850975 RepID=UPI0025456AE3|nr:uncharacterized protein N7511_010843 [Penicillium nucicola]KAJ5749147.1 hypothetical protein N7511_010843 [Penicillium nucicola]